MSRTFRTIHWTLFFFAALSFASLSIPSGAQAADDLAKTDPIPSSADPVANVKIERAFPNLKFQRPIYLIYIPDGTGRLAVISQYGTVLIFPNDPNVEEAKELVNIDHKVVY